METYLDQERMKYDYENVLEYAVEQGEARGEAKGRAEGREEGRSEGLAEGLIEGENKGKRETAKNLLSLGDSVEKIAIVTGLSAQEIRELNATL